MNNELNLAAIDIDGAIQEMDEAVIGDSRADFFRKAAVAGGGLVGGGVLLGLPAMAMGAPSKKQDVQILNYALTLEYLEAAFYNEAVQKGNFNAEVMAAAKTTAAHENAHVTFLKKALGSAAVKKPKFDFKGSNLDQAKFVATAAVLEDTGVSAYSGQATRIKQAAVVKAAVSILTVEARHASQFRTLEGKVFAPLAFDRAKTMAQILKAVKATGFIVG
jgi:rubrerythrin